VFINLIKKLVIFIIGFDEKLVIRSGFRIGIQPGDMLYSFIALVEGSLRRVRLLKLLKRLGIFLLIVVLNLEN